MQSAHSIQDYLDVVKQGIAKKFGDGKPKRVVIVGAGLAGLVAGYELRRAGHTPIILEAQQRVGGRVYTLRDPFTEGLYAEVGAMRIPRAHTLTMSYVEKFGLKTNDFTMDNLNAYHFMGGRKVRASEAAKDPSLLGFDVSGKEKGKTAGKMYEAALKPLLELLDKDGDKAWEEIIAKYDQYSTREFLELNGWSEGMIEMFGLLANQESVMNSSFLELFREDSGNYYTNMIELDGGTDRLPHAFLPELKDNIRFGAKMIAMDQSPTDVTIHYQTQAGRFEEKGDYAIITVPFPVLRHVEVLKPFTRAKNRAIRQLHYDASAKILFQCKRRFWEEDDGIFGGGTMTDLPIRNLYYPDHGRETGRGVILASYTWSEDAQRWQKQGHPGWLLWRGDDLAVLRKALPSLEVNGDLGAGERGFALASVRGARRRQVLAVGGVLSLIAALVGVGTLALWAKEQARQARESAKPSAAPEANSATAK